MTLTMPQHCSLLYTVNPTRNHHELSSQIPKVKIEIKRKNNDLISILVKPVTLTLKVQCCMCGKDPWVQRSTGQLAPQARGRSATKAPQERGLLTWEPSSVHQALRRSSYTNN